MKCILINGKEKERKRLGIQELLKGIQENDKFYKDKARSNMDREKIIN